MLSVEVHREAEFEVEGDVLARAARHVLTRQGRDRGSVSVTLLDDAAIQALNAEYLGHDWATDVLSFDLSAGGPDVADSGSDPVMADIYLGAERARAQAEEHGVPVEEELVRLVVHGVLHALGHDHPAEDREASPFFRLQEQLVAEVVGP